MSLGLVGKKIGMTQVTNDRGDMIPVTVVEAGPCFITQIKSKESDGYEALQVGYEKIKESKNNKPKQGHLKKASVSPIRVLKEFRMDGEKLDSYKLGQEIKISDLFKEGQCVDIVGRTKGRGFTGVIKRHNMHGAPGGHGTHEFFRHAGSLGCRKPQHVVKGRRMPGRYGNERVTVQNMEVVMVKSDENLLLIKGAIPGHNKSYLTINPALKRKVAKKKVA
ncbi:MAG: 50S ribosomal protein L3 [bacterium]